MTKRAGTASLILVLLMLAAPASDASAQDTPRRLAARRVKDLGPLADPAARKVLLSDDGEHAVMIVKREGKDSVVHDGVEGPRYDEINALQLSPDGARFAYRAKTGGKWVIVIDGKPEPVYARTEEYLVFSPDGAHFCYVAHHDGLSRRVKDPVYVEEYDGKDVIVLDGQELMPPMGSLNKPVFSPDGKHLAYAVTVGTYDVPNRHFAVLDGKKGAVYDEVCFDWGRGYGSQVFSPDSRRLAYLARKGRDYMIVCDDKPQAPFDEIRELFFSPDSRRLAYVAVRAGKSHVVLDGQEGPAYDEVGLPGFSPDGSRLAFPARRGGGAWFMVCDGKEGPAYDGVPGGDGPVFSPDGRRLAWRAIRDKQAFVVVDGKEGARFDRVGKPFFSPDGRHLAFQAERKREPLLVCDGREAKTRLHPLAASFSPDSRHLACVTATARYLIELTLLCDGIESPKLMVWFEWPSGDRVPWMRWTSGGKLRYIEVDAAGAHLMELDMPGDRDWTNGFTPAPRDDEAKPQ